MRYLRSLRRRCRTALEARSAPKDADGWAVAYEPALVPPVQLMRTEGIDVLEEWFRWAEEWSMLLRVYGRLRRNDAVLEIGCGLGRIAFPLRHLLSERGTYDGFEIVAEKVEFLQRTFEVAHPNFRFRWADIHNTFYNPTGRMPAAEYRFPYDDHRFDVVFAASVFTHLLPESTARYLAESARVLRDGGRCVFSFLLLDHYRQGHPRPLGFDRDVFALDHRYGGHGAEFAIAVPDNPEQTSAYRLSLVERLAGDAGLRLAQPPVPGLWSGTIEAPVGAQDVVVLERI
jgi:SAM-dependent methyltransferase